MLPSAETLIKAVGCTPARASRYVGPIREACEAYSITTPKRLAAFLAQTGHESASFGQVSENLNYSAERLREICEGAPRASRWRSLLPRVEQLARDPEALGNAAYGGRMGNRAEATGDGYRYRARGLIGNTGAANYEAITELLAKKFGGVPDFTLHPELLESPRWAALAAGAFWEAQGCNKFADADKFDEITQRVNGGQYGKADRRSRYARALKVLSA